MSRVLLAVICVAVAGCGDNLDASAPDAAPDARVPDAAALAFVGAPMFTLAPNPAGPQTGRIDVTTTRPTRVSLRITDAERTLMVTLPTLATTHAVPVLGLRAATTHQVTLEVTDASGTSLTAAPFTATPAALPADLTTFTTIRTLPAQIEPGVTFTTMRHYIVAVDDLGRVVWFVDAIRGLDDVRRLPGGTFLAGYRDHLGGLEIDVYGNILREWYAANMTVGPTGSIPVAIDSFHHELALQPDGDLLALSTERKTYANYPTSETDPTPRAGMTALVGDVIAVFAPDGTVRKRLSVLDALDPYRVAYNSFGSFWATYYSPVGALDWSHGNGVIRDPSDGGFVVSLRHQDALVKLDANGALVWILGTHDNWTSAFAPYLLAPVGAPFAWQFHQHAPRLLANGHLLVFDNGNYRVSPPTPPPLPSTSYSRAVEYAIDPTLKQVRQVWEYDAGRTIFAAATGDVDVGPVTGNVIVTFGGASRIVEVTHTDPAVVVFEMTASETFYRSERLPLYP